MRDTMKQKVSCRTLPIPDEIAAIFGGGGRNRCRDEITGGKSQNLRFAAGPRSIQYLPQRHLALQIGYPGYSAEACCSAVSFTWHQTEEAVVPQSPSFRKWKIMHLALQLCCHGTEPHSLQHLMVEWFLIWSRPCGSSRLHEKCHAEQSFLSTQMVSKHGPVHS